MPNDDQAQADTADQLPVADPLEDAANSTTSGTSELEAYEAEVAAALNEDTTHGDEPAEVATDAGVQQTYEESNDEVSEDEAEAAGEKSQERFRFKGDEDKAIAALAKATGKSLREAAKAYEAMTEGTQTQQQAETQAAESQETRETAASVQARIEELENLENEASDALELETAKEYRIEANKLRYKLIDLKIAEVQERSTAEAEETSRFYDDYEKNKATAIGFYPDAEGAFDPKSDKANTAQAKRMIELDAQMRELGDPVFHSSKKALVLAQQAAYELGIPMKKPGSAPEKQKVVHNRPIQTASGNARTTATDPAKRATETIDGIRSMRDYDDVVNSL